MGDSAKHLREYETVFLVRPELTDDNVDKVKDRVRGIIEREGGKSLKFTIWGKKRTMYPIAKQPRAIYVHSHYLGKPSLVAEIERNLRNLDEVTRFLSVKIAENVDPDSKAVEPDVRLAGDVDGDATKPGGVGPEGGLGLGFRDVEAADDDETPEL